MTMSAVWRSSVDSYPWARSCPSTSSLSSTFIWQPNVSRYSFLCIDVRESIRGMECSFKSQRLDCGNDVDDQTDVSRARVGGGDRFARPVAGGAGGEAGVVSQVEPARRTCGSRGAAA